MENPITVLERWTMCFSSYKNCKLKIKLWWVEAHKRKKNKLYKNKVYFVHRTYFQHLGFISIYSVFNKLSAYERTLLHTLLLLVFKIVESLQCIPTQFLGSILWGIIPFTWKGNNTILNILIPCVAANSMIKQNMCDIKILWLIGLWPENWPSFFQYTQLQLKANVLSIFASWIQFLPHMYRKSSCLRRCQ